MKMLLDTHLLLWAAGAPNELPIEVRALLEDNSNEPFFSAASLWEIAIKNSLGREDFQADSRILRRGLLDNGYVELPITSSHAVFIQNLPSIHKDPFDRILIAQATLEGITLFTSDTVVAKYSGPIQFYR
ncbi:MAG: type II toxin-antitoxin system VapC family toxin [Tatlockia sp.]|nr:type II toxin-antitoxin system VapC family toxin [Tatlockia sp.]